MDYLALYTQVQDMLALKGTTGKARAQTMVLRAYRMFIGGHPWGFNQKLKADVSIVDTTNVVSFPTDFRLRVKGGFRIPAEDKTLVFQEKDEFYENYPNLKDGTDEGVPAIYTLRGWDATSKALQVILAPWPDQAYTGSLDYFYQPPDLSGDTDEPEAPTYLHIYIAEIAQALGEEYHAEKSFVLVMRRVAAIVARAISLHEGEEDRDIQMRSVRDTYVKLRSTRRHG